MRRSPQGSLIHFTGRADVLGYAPCLFLACGRWHRAQAKVSSFRGLGGGR